MLSTWVYLILTLLKLQFPKECAGQTRNHTKITHLVNPDNHLLVSIKAKNAEDSIWNSTLSQWLLVPELIELLGIESKMFFIASVGALVWTSQYSPNASVCFSFATGQPVIHLAFSSKYLYKQGIALPCLISLYTYATPPSTFRLLI